jgi:hypothetical protein
MENNNDCYSCSSNHNSGSNNGNSDSNNGNNSYNRDNNDINDFVENTKNNSSDYSWIRFSKGCNGYSFMFPFVKNDSIQSLYRVLDAMYKEQYITILDENNKIIHRSDTRCIRDYLRNNNILMPPNSIVYDFSYACINLDNISNNKNCCRFNIIDIE